MEKKTNNKNEECKDRQCPFHGELASRGRKFEGYVTKKFPRRIVIEFERMVRIEKYERYLKTKSKMHARLPDCLANSINVGDYVEIGECRPLSKIIHFVVLRKIHDKDIRNDEQTKVEESK